METGKDQQRINELAFKWMKGIITPGEREEFMQWYKNADDGQAIAIPEDISTDEVTHGLKIFSGISGNIQTEKAPVRKLSWLRYAAAIIIIAGVGAYFFNSGTKKEQLTVKIEPARAQKDVAAPTSVNAIITLGDGRKIVLDSSGNGLLATQGNIQLTKVNDGEIVYNGDADKISFNTLANPRGSKVIQITLADGTRVWLNSESSIRYPTGFKGDERVVEVTGETYFEVAKNPSMPFRVRKNGMEIMVTGTHFNVNAYDEEEKMKITLIEGSVRVTSATNNSVTLKPGQQSQLTRDGSLSLVKDVDVDGVTAWKDGKFMFDGKTDIGTIMRQIARWYDLEVNYEGQIKTHFSGSISRSANLSQVLKKIETTGMINFQVEGKKVIVKP
jgi:transmembrane sensor